MKNFFNNKLLVGALSFLVLAGFINAIAVINFSSDSQTAQVGGTLIAPLHGRVTYGPEENDYGAATGLSFKRNKTITINACAAGGGGGGGGRGYENGSDIGNGGGGGGGGGKGSCRKVERKLQAGDVLRWNIGRGGFGGLPGHILVETYGNYDEIENSSPTGGGNGGWTYVSVNGVDILQLEGGHGGLPGSDAYTTTAYGGLGGSTLNSGAVWHRGQNGYLATEVPNSCQNSGFGGWGGNGEINTSDGEAENAGRGGYALFVPGYGCLFNYDTVLGGSGGIGELSFGGGGGGGGIGRWQDFPDLSVYFAEGLNSFDILDSNNMYYPFYQSEYPHVEQRGGWGGTGGDGFLEISW